MKPADIFSHWKKVRQGTLMIIDVFEDDELFYQAYPGAWPAGQIMIHIADAEEGWFRYAVTKELNEWPSQLNFDNYQDKRSILEALIEAGERTTLYLQSLSEEDLSETIITPWEERFSLYWIFWHVLEHEIHHRGELSLILGLLGKEGWGV